MNNRIFLKTCLYSISYDPISNGYVKIHLNHENFHLKEDARKENALWDGDTVILYSDNTVLGDLFHAQVQLSRL